MRAGRPLDFSEFADRAEDSAVLRKVTDEVMDELTRLVQEHAEGLPAPLGLTEEEEG